MFGENTSFIPVDLLLLAYRQGVFPMSEGRDQDEVFWVEPKLRAVIFPDDFRFSRSLRKTVARDKFVVTCDQDFGGCIGP